MRFFFRDASDAKIFGDKLNKPTKIDPFVVDGHCVDKCKQKTAERFCPTVNFYFVRTYYIPSIDGEQISQQQRKIRPTGMSVAPLAHDKGCIIASAAFFGYFLSPPKESNVQKRLSCATTKIQRAAATDSSRSTSKHVFGMFEFATVNREKQHEYQHEEKYQRRKRVHFGVNADL